MFEDTHSALVQFGLDFAADYIFPLDISLVILMNFFCSMIIFIKL